MSLVCLRINQSEECATKHVFGKLFGKIEVVGKCLLDFVAGLTVSLLVTVLFYIFLVVLLQEFSL